MWHRSGEDLQNEIIEAARIVAFEKERFEKMKSDPSIEKNYVEGAYNALEMIGNQLKEAAMGRYLGFQYDGKLEERIPSAIKELLKEWRKLQELDVQMRRNAYDDGHADAIKWVFDYRFIWINDL